MKTLVLAAALLAICSAASVDYHDTLDDQFDFNKLTSEEIRDIVYCLNDEAPCTDLIASYKKHYPAAIIEHCARCNSDQKTIALVFFQRLEKEWPQELLNFRNKYDPQGRDWDTFYQTLKDAKA